MHPRRSHAPARTAGSLAPVRLWYASAALLKPRLPGYSDILMSEEGAKKYRKNWARLIQKIYKVDPLTCPKCQRKMRILTFIEDEEVIEKILFCSAVTHSFHW